MVPRKKSINNPGTMLLFPAASMYGEIESDKEWRVVDGPIWRPAVECPPFCAVDFESYYDKGFSLDTMSAWEYISHPAFQATLVALEWYQGDNIWKRWVGKVEEAPWQDIIGIEWWSHNANFDELVARRLKHNKINITIPDIWNCTMDLAAYLQLDRGLASCAPLLINEAADKTIREKMKGGGATADEQKDYAGSDGRQCAWIRYAHGHRWPELESYLSRLMRRAGYVGIYGDQQLMTNAKVAMITLMRQIEKEIPWANIYTVSSDKGIGLECDKLGIPRPYSLSLDDVETEIWQKRYDKKGWLEKIRNYTKCKLTISHIEMMKERTRKDGSIPFELVYRKAPHTARWQSGSGLRIQNLDKDPFNGYHVRHFISAFPNEDILSADSSQIEPRVQNWLVRDEIFLKACKAGSSPYDAHARSTMGWTGGDLKKLSKESVECMALYALAKARVLALGYQAGPPKFVEMARTMAGLTVFETEKSYSPDLKEFYHESQIKDRIARNDLSGWSIFPAAVDAVADFRSKSKLIVNDWYASENAIRKCAGRDHIVNLPNGERIFYFDVRVGASSTNFKGYTEKGDITAWVIKNSKVIKNKKYLYGGKLVENKVQRVAREVLAHFKYQADIRLRKFGLRIMWSAHDEINARSPKSESKFLMEGLMEIMHTPPPWAPDLPVAAEGQILDHYVK